MPNEPVRRQAANLNEDLREMIDAQLTRWNDLLITLAAMEPGDPAAEVTLLAAAQVLTGMGTYPGPVHGWLLAARRTLFEESKRLLPPEQRFNPPNWTESF